ncbi:MAG: MotA/TolQ/ExbB proton channel family protein [Gemmataceae bacterium]|nr:MotA/TolQ/ExbB proton channel family protein [Gemmataceae bacterium]MCI0742731.1 MotA/TolQ/ExbB proton channel family protein [Gemmataceae bacterium]
MRRLLIKLVVPLCFCAMPFLAAALIAVCIPRDAVNFYFVHFGTMDGLILGLGLVLFLLQMMLCWRALRWQGTGFDEGADRWISHLGQAAEWFPLMGLLGTVAGILQTFSALGAMPDASGSFRAQVIFQQYSPAITATGSGLFMALLNILPSWMVIIGRDLILTLGGSRPTPLAPAGRGEGP